MYGTNYNYERHTLKKTLLEIIANPQLNQVISSWSGKEMVEVLSYTLNHQCFRGMK